MSLLNDLYLTKKQDLITLFQNLPDIDIIAISNMSLDYSASALTINPTGDEVTFKHLYGQKDYLINHGYHFPTKDLHCPNNSLTQKQVVINTFNNPLYNYTESMVKVDDNKLQFNSFDHFLYLAQFRTQPQYFIQDILLYPPYAERVSNYLYLKLSHLC